jgi:hypothetical protein
MLMYQNSQFWNETTLFFQVYRRLMMDTFCMLYDLYQFTRWEVTQQFAGMFYITFLQALMNVYVNSTKNSSL